MVSCIPPTHCQPSGVTYAVVWHSSSELASPWSPLFLNPRIIASESNFMQAALTERERHAQKPPKAHSSPEGCGGRSSLPEYGVSGFPCGEKTFRVLHPVRGGGGILSLVNTHPSGCTAGSVTLYPIGVPGVDKEERCRREENTVRHQTTKKLNTVATLRMEWKASSTKAHVPAWRRSYCVGFSSGI